MKLNVIRADDSLTHVALIGRLDVPGVNEIQYEFFHQVISLPRSTLVDLSKLTYLASFGISMLVSAAKELERHGAKMVLVAPTAMVRQSLETSSLHDLIPIANEETAALAALR